MFRYQPRKAIGRRVWCAYSGVAGTCTTPRQVPTGCQTPWNGSSSARHPWLPALSRLNVAQTVIRQPPPWQVDKRCRVESTSTVRVWEGSACADRCASEASTSCRVLAVESTNSRSVSWLGRHSDADRPLRGSTVGTDGRYRGNRRAHPDHLRHHHRGRRKCRSGEGRSLRPGAHAASRLAHHPSQPARRADPG
jgi:hypothetical protein